MEADRYEISTVKKLKLKKFILKYTFSKYLIGHQNLLPSEKSRKLV